MVRKYLRMKLPLVSVIIPTFNRAYCLRDSIQSVLDQRAFELIVVNDGSKDDTDKILGHFPKIKVKKYNNNRGVSFARNKGLEKAKGSLICFLDSDDIWEEGKLETQVKWMQGHPECKAVYTDEIWIRNGVRVNPMNKHKKYSGDIFKQCLPLCIVSPSSIMLRKSVLEEVGRFDEKMPVCEDYDLWLRIAVRYHFKFLKEKFIVKRGGHDDQLSRKHWGMDRWRHRSKGLVASLRNMGRCRSRQRTVGQGLYSVGHFDVIACLSGGLDVWDGGHVAMFFSA